MPEALDIFAIRSALAWVALEVLPVRLFPWFVAHTQASFYPLNQIAEFFGALGVSFAVLWLAESLVLTFKGRNSYRCLAVNFGIVMTLSLIAAWRGEEVLSEQARPLNAMLVQSQTTVASSKIIGLTRSSIRPDTDLVIWPEGALPFPLPETIQNEMESEMLPRLKVDKPLLMGAASTDDSHKEYNSAYLLEANGRLQGPYHKRALMPLGEYIPYQDILPWLRRIEPLINPIELGSKVAVFSLPTEYGAVKLSPLICYEEVVSELARESVTAGAELLVTLSSDGWLEKDQQHAMEQRHAIARFRSIENRRFLIRVSNVGITSVVNPLGEVTKQLPIYEDHVYHARVFALNEQTLYSYLGDWPWYGVAFIVFLCVAVSPFRSGRIKAVLLSCSP